jgi:endonuclease/exonuclease/phosphatase family metal-dependent hydrolase
MHKLGLSILWFFNIISALGLLLAYLAPYIDPSILSFPAFFGLAFPLFLLLNIIFVILWIFIKWKYSLLSLVIIVLGYSYVKPHVQLFPEKKQQKNDGIKVVTFNVKNFSHQGSKNIPKTIDSIKTLFKKINPDIFCFQEFKNIKKNSLSFDNYKTYGDEENVIFTKFKVVKSGNLIDERNFKFGNYIDVIFKNDTIRVFNVQLVSYSVSRDIEQYEKEPEKIQPKKKFMQITRKLNNGFKARVTETFKLKQSILESPYPVIACGDFNDTPASFTYREITSTNVKDAFTESGKGYGNTYNGYLPKIRIDYIFASKQFDIFNYNVIKTNISDHYPVFSFLVLYNR